MFEKLFQTSIARLGRLTNMARSIHFMASGHAYKLYIACGLLFVIGVAEGAVVILMVSLATNILGGIELPEFFKGFSVALGLENVPGVKAKSLLVVMLFLAIRQIAVGAMRTYMYAIAPSLITAIRDVIIKNLLSAKFSYLDNYESGSFRQVLLQETGRTVVAARAMIELAGHIVTISVVIALMYYMAPDLTIITGCIGFILIPIRLWYARLLHQYERRSLDCQFSLTNTLEEVLANLRMIKLVGLTERSREQVRELSLKTMWLRFYSNMLHIWDPLFLYIGMLTAISVIIFFSDGYFSATPEELIAFLLIMYRLIGPIVAASGSFNLILSNEPHVHASMRYYQPDAERRERDTGEKIPRQRIDKISFDSVSFGYSKNVKALNDISFEAKLGEITAIVGPSGAGKSTISNLLLGMYQRDSGAIQFEGDALSINIDELHLESIRDLVGVVTQDVTIFNETIREVIRGGDTATGDDDVEYAAQRADAHNFILKLPQGYDTVVGERGVLLSGGQRQRLLIAEILARRTPILILDEATSALDLPSERNFYRTLHELINDCLIIVITHRITNLTDCKKILVLNQGGLCESGSWDDLVAQKGTLFNMLHDKENKSTDVAI